MVVAPGPKIPEVSRITRVESLLPMAREMVTRKEANMYEGIGIKRGQNVLVISDTTADQLVVQAMTTAMQEKGGHVTNITLGGFRGLKDPVDMADNMFSTNWYPGWAWQAANEADIVFLTAFLKYPLTPVPALSNKPQVDNMEMTADLMVSEYESFPVEIRDTIDEVAWETMLNCTRVKWTDLEGTDITWSVTPAEWTKAMESERKRSGNRFKPGHLNLPAPSLEMNGVYVSSSLTFAGPVPRTTLLVEKGKVVKIEGGGKLGDRMAETNEKYRNLKAPNSRCPGPGVDWITTIAFGTNPKARRSPFFEELEGSARVYAWTFGHRRSGVIHTSVGEGYISSTRNMIRFMDTYFNTIVTDKGPLMENGHLLALDDPRVRQVAAKYGDPEQLLKEIWVPAVSGVNAG